MFENAAGFIFVPILPGGARDGNKSYPSTLPGFCHIVPIPEGSFLLLPETNTSARTDAGFGNAKDHRHDFDEEDAMELLDRGYAILREDKARYASGEKNTNL